jgi:hypothetical protein
VTEQWKTGDYGTTIWHHRLECGHVEQRRRKPVAQEIACTHCEVRDQVETVAPITHTDAHAMVMADSAIVRAQIAGAFQVPLDAVVVQVQIDRIAGALVLLDPRQIQEIIKR